MHIPTYFKLRSTIKPKLKKNLLLKGTFFSFIGVFIWLVCSVFIPVYDLNYTGWLIYMVGGAFIVFGLLPYKKISRLENNPSEIIVSQDEYLYAFVGGALLIKISLDNIEALKFIDRKNDYGISISLKTPVLEKSEVFLPFFSKVSFSELYEVIFP